LIDLDDRAINLVGHISSVSVVVVNEREDTLNAGNRFHLTGGG
jgi:hypothetical protein